VIRAQSQDAPGEFMSLFRSDDPDKDANRFWRLLEEWYRDTESNLWHAPWDGFTFPGDANFGAATFTGDAVFRIATFTGDDDFGGATFTGEADFRGATFTGEAYFGRATFTGYAHFSPATFTGNADFISATFAGSTDFIGATFTRYARFEDATFAGGITFWHATFTRAVSFNHATFTGDASFNHATFTGSADFRDATFIGDADFSDATIAQKAQFASLKLADQPRLSLRRCSLAKVELRSLDLRSLGPGVIRLAYADEIERLTLRDVKWPEKDNRPRTADEVDLDDDDLAPEKRPSSDEVERVYRGLRKNHEDRGDRVGGHGWYFSEMEVGRIHAKRSSLKRVARGFYKATSNYGLSAIRPAIWLGVAVAVSLVLFSLGAGWCPARLAVDPATEACVGLQDRLQVALLAIFLQAPSSGIVLSGVLGQIVWLVLRITGAAMLLSIGIAFRNQIAR
jgi:uncharacterized protein YjbI with pentapeptide repeats